MSTSRSLLILGAGVYQVPLIRKAREMGFRTIVASPPGRFPGIELADTLWEIDTTDVAGILSAARRERLAGVVTSGTDVCLPALGAVVDELGLIGPSAESAKLSSDKVLMKQAFKKTGVPTAQFEVVEGIEAARDAASRIGFPVMVKATDSSGSRGISRADDEKSLAVAWEAATQVSRNGRILVERYLDGLEFGAQAFVCGRNVVEVLAHNDQVTSPPIQTPIGHSMPVRFDAAMVNQMKQVTFDAVRALQITDAVCNVDLMLHDGDIKVLEIGARMGATCLPENISVYAGHDVYEYMIQRAVGESVEFKVTSKQPNASLLLGAKRNGVVESVHDPECGSKSPQLVELVIDVNPGDRVKQFAVGPDRIGSVVVTGASAEAAEDIARSMVEQIEVEIT